MQIREIIAELIEYHYMYEYILALIKSIYSLIKVSRFWVKGYIKTMTLNAGLKKYMADTCLLYIVNELRNVIIVVYIYSTIEIRDKPALVHTIECIKK